MRSPTETVIATSMTMDRYCHPCGAAADPYGHLSSGAGTGETPVPRAAIKRRTLAKKERREEVTPRREDNRIKQPFEQT